MKFVTVTQADGRLAVKAPYYPDFNEDARKLGGKWQDSSSTWLFDPRLEAEVRAKLLHHFGEDDSGEEARVEVLLDLNRVLGYGGKLAVLGRVVASRRNRDWRVQLGPGVAILEGGFPDWGGSVKNPKLAAEPDTVLKVFDVPRSLAERVAAEREGITVVAPDSDSAPPVGGVELVANPGSPASDEPAFRVDLDPLLANWTEQRNGCPDAEVRALDADFALMAGLPVLAALHRIVSGLENALFDNRHQVSTAEMLAEIRNLVYLASGEASARSALLGCRPVPGVVLMPEIPIMEQMVKKSGESACS